MIGAAVGVGAGVSLANRSQSAESLSSSSTSALPTTSLSPASTGSSLIMSSTPTPTTTQSTTVSTTSIVGPSTTLYRDCPSSDNTLHDITLGEKTYTFRKFCNTVLLTIGDNSLVNQATTDLNTCINKCALYNHQNASEIAAGDPACNTVCWWNNVDVQLPGQCWGFVTQNSSAGEFQFEQQVICDSAGWINES
ncbi:hypothetical protein FJTKL_07667 [Diaporthe vaccinii]|uniref:Apple domain-containing protein n=1 Tax=Diaporthe vaccinii TaxID=105482 RepID=A0ABR4ET85_9PEZI